MPWLQGFFEISSVVDLAGLPVAQRHHHLFAQQRALMHGHHAPSILQRGVLIQVGLHAVELDAALDYAVVAKGKQTAPPHALEAAKPITHALTCVKISDTKVREFTPPSAARAALVPCA